MTAPAAHAFWLFGLSGAGKSTLAERLGRDLRQRGLPVLLLDGDTLRSGLCAGLGFSDADRSENLRRAAEAAKLGVTSRLCVVASFITPLENQRERIRTILGRENVSLIYLSASIEVCRARDVKGLYAKASTGGLQQMTGISSAFEPPAAVDLTLETSRDPVETCAGRLRDFAVQRLNLEARS